MPEELTPVERKIFDYLLDYLRRNTYQPSIREIGREFGIKSTKTVAEHLQSLADKGWIERDPSRSRGVRLVGAEVYPPFLTVRCYDGFVGEGDPFTAEVSVGEYRIDPRLAECRDPFFLRMPGDDLGADGILTGDLLLVERAGMDEVRSGEIVVARLRGAGLVRRLREGPDGLFLEASDGARPPLPVVRREDLAVFGRVVGVYRQVRASRAAVPAPTAAPQPILPSP